MGNLYIVFGREFCFAFCMNANVYFYDREDAGWRLAERLMQFKSESLIVLALPRGGIVLGAEVSRKLNCPLDLIIPRKIGYPGNPEYAIAAVTENGAITVNESDVSTVDPVWFKREKEAQIAEAKRRRKVYLKGRKQVKLRGKTIIIIDDGIATGLTMKAAISEVKAKNPVKIIVAVPVAPADIYKQIKGEVDDLIVVDASEYYLGSVGAYYKNFPQVSDNEVIAILNNM